MTLKTKWIGFALIIAGAAACNSGDGGSSASAQSLGEKCATDADCKTTESCLGQVCVPKLPADLGIPLCATTADCKTSEICEHGVCLPHQLDDGGVTLCDHDADCASGDQCLAGVCVPKLPSGGSGWPFDLGAWSGVGQSCTQNSDCSGTLDCAFGFCLPVATCHVDADCAAGKHCATQAGLCI